MNVLSAQYYAERIASDCGAIHWLKAINDSEKAGDSADYLAAKMPEALALLAGALGYRIEKTSAEREASDEPLKFMWMTYEEIAQRRGGTAEAARQKAIRENWQRRLDPDGRAKVLVPVESRGGEWVTYEQLAKIRGIDPESAKTLVRRRGFERRIAPDGRAEIFMPQPAIQGDFNV